MPPRVRSTTFAIVLISAAILTPLCLDTFRDAFTGGGDNPALLPPPLAFPADQPNLAVLEDHSPDHQAGCRHVSSVADRDSVYAADSILFPDWEVLVVAAHGSYTLPPAADDDNYTCLFSNNAASPAKRAWVLPSTNQTTFVCALPKSTRRRRPFIQPVLVRSQPVAPVTPPPPPPEDGSRELIRWTFLTYESVSTMEDVVVFAKGVNQRQGINRPASELTCVFSSESDPAVSVRTAVTSSAQEVFRCPHPPADFPASGGGHRMKVSLEVSEATERTVVVPSVAQYTPWRTPAARGAKALLCACTMVYDVAKFLREWVVYHSEIGVEKFLLYDNGSEDELEKAIQELVEEGNYDVKRVIWPWPKTQEAGFSHCAVNARDSCEWMMYIDVDEFVFSPNWLNSSHPSKDMLRSFLPRNSTSSAPSSISPTNLNSSSARLPVGEVSINCKEFGPSNQRVHPPAGVMQGYTCRRKMEQRHKSMVRLDAIDESLLNVIHHFKVKEEYRMKAVGTGEAVVNHYKYQAWPEFRAKFRRRVSAYVVDWREEMNPGSKDRTPGLGFQAVEPEGWAERFCEVRDDRLKAVTERWFGIQSQFGFRMAWQR